jgi:hypothetical protein
MKRLWVFVCALLLALAFGSGCQTEDGRGIFDDALKDWRGDNMQMRGLSDQPPSTRSRN